MYSIFENINYIHLLKTNKFFLFEFNTNLISVRFNQWQMKIECLCVRSCVLNCFNCPNNDINKIISTIGVYQEALLQVIIEITQLFSIIYSSQIYLKSNTLI